MSERRVRKSLVSVVVICMLVIMIPASIFAVVPANPPTLAAFTDEDTNGGEISGTFSWTAATSEADITDYKVYFWDGSAKVGTEVATVAKAGSNSYVFAADTAIPVSATHIAVFAYNVDGEETTGSKVAISDDSSGDVPANPPTSALFTDTDTNAGQIGGTFSWTAANPETDITGYKVYFWNGSAKVGAAVTSVAKGGTDSYAFAANTAIPAGATHIAVFAYNTNGDEATGSKVAISDNNSGDVPANPPTLAAFTDSDTDAGQIGGTLSWTAANPEADITGYKVYFWNGSAKVGAAVTTVAKGGTNSYSFAANTAIPAGATHIAVFAYNANGEEASGSKVAISDDSSAPVALGGTVSITGTAKFGQVLTADTSGLTSQSGSLSYQWKRAGSNIVGETASTYTLVEADIGQVITVTVTSSGNTGSITSTATTAIAKADGPGAPSAPTVSGTPTATSITLTTIAGAEYAISSIAGVAQGSFTWQDSTTFTGLVHSTQYKFVARIKQTTTVNASSDSTQSAAITTADIYTLANTAVTTAGGFKKTTVSVTMGSAIALTDARLVIVGERIGGGQACWVYDLATANGDGGSVEIAVTSSSFSSVKVYLIDGAPDWTSSFTGVKADVLTIITQ